MLNPPLTIPKHAVVCCVPYFILYSKHIYNVPSTRQSKIELTFYRRNGVILYNCVPFNNNHWMKNGLTYINIIRVDGTQLPISLIGCLILLNKTIDEPKLVKNWLCFFSLKFSYRIQVIIYTIYSTSIQHCRELKPMQCILIFGMIWPKLFWILGPEWQISLINKKGSGGGGVEPVDTSPRSPLVNTPLNHWSFNSI